MRVLNPTTMNPPSLPTGTEHTALLWSAAPIAQISHVAESSNQSNGFSHLQRQREITSTPGGSIGRNGQMPILVGVSCVLDSMAGLLSEGLPFWLTKPTQKKERSSQLSRRELRGVGPAICLKQRPHRSNMNSRNQSAEIASNHHEAAALPREPHKHLYRCRGYVSRQCAQHY